MNNFPYSYSSRRSVLRVVMLRVSELFAIIFTVGCGFSPLYNRQDVDTTELAWIRVSPIGDRIGQILRNTLLERITTYNMLQVPRYLLSVKLDLSTQYINFRKDNTASRANLIVSAVYKLYNIMSNEYQVILKGIEHAVVGYDILDAPYAGVVAEQEAQQRAALELADKIVTSITIHFLNRKQNS